MSLVPQFAFSTDELQITLIDITPKESGDTWTRLWEILLDNTVVFSASSETYTEDLEDGLFYEVKLTLTDSEGPHITSVKLATSGGIILPHQSINEIVQALLPNAEIDWDQVQTLKIKWQGILCNGLDIPEGNCYNELAYPQNANTLIAYLIVRDIITYSVTSIVAGGGSGGGGIKKIVTGPTEVERYSVSDMYANLTGSSDPYDLFLDELCSLASSLQIGISGCENNRSTVLSVFYGSDYSYIHQYPVAPQFQKRYDNN